jgi:spore coat polysaccharide biosynthesis protein SpsF
MKIVYIIILNIDIFIPIRLGSSRLPKKSLKKINGKFILLHLIDRLQNIENIRNIVVCTTTSSIDDELVDHLSHHNILYFRGSEHDILDRYMNAAQKFNTEFIVNVEGDDIYTDSECVYKISEEFLKTNSDYIDISNMPLGLSTTGIKVTALQKVCLIKQSKNTETGYKEFFTENKLFKIQHIILNQKFNFPKNTRLTLDYEEDYELAKQIFKILGNDFHKSDLAQLLEKNPNLLEITNNLEKQYYTHFEQNRTNTSIKDM